MPDIMSGQPAAVASAQTDCNCVGKETEPLVSIVIPVFNQLELTRQCLSSIAETTRRPYETIVVDNGSNDGTARYLESEPVVFLRNDENLGISVATSQGIALARGKYICLFNNDVICLQGWLEPLLSCLASDPAIGLAGPKQVTPQGKIWHAGTVFFPCDDPVHPRAPIHVFTGFQEDDPLVNTGGSFPAMNFGCALIRAELFRELGMLDDETYVFPGYFEDVDWCLRLRKAGYLCYYCPESKVIHPGGRTLGGSGDKFKRMCLETAEKNLDRLREKWGDEPESFFVPDETRELVKKYFTSAIYLEKLNTILKEQLEGTREHIRELGAYVKKLEKEHDAKEVEINRAADHNLQVEEYVGSLETALHEKSLQVEKAAVHVEKIGREMARLDKAYAAALGEADAVNARVSVLERALSEKLTSKLGRVLRRVAGRYLAR